MKSFLLKVIHIVLFFAFVPFLTCASSEKRNFTLVIDAGHGGHDAGAVGSFSKEKNINLNVALALGRLIEDNCTDVKVIYTRKRDVFISLQGRADIANRNKADLFISIHTNALPNGKQAYGSETYTLGMARASANLAVAKRENSVITMESDYKTTYQGFDPNKAESYVIFEFMQDRFMKQSVDLASCIQKQYKAVGRPNKGVHQAGFLVLRNTGMPSVLTELGFITTPQEETYLNSQQGIAELSQSIYNGFLEYRRQHDRTAAEMSQSVPKAIEATNVAEHVEQQGAAAKKEVEVVPVEAVPTARLVEQQKGDSERPLLVSRKSSAASSQTNVALRSQKKNNTIESKSRSERVEPSDKQTLRTPTTQVGKKNNVDDSPSSAKSVTPNKPNKKLKNSDTVLNSRERVDGARQSVSSSKETKTLAQNNKEGKSVVNNNAKNAKQTTKKQTTSAASLSYRIQVGAGKREIETSDPQFKGLSINRVKEGNMYKYFYGKYRTYAEAQKALRTVKEKMAAAYVVAYENGKAISVAEARAKEKEKK